MLHVDHISNVQLYSDEWQLTRRGKFTSSRIFTLMGDKPFTDGAMTYIYHKVGEELTGHITAEDDQFEDENTAWGNTYEPEALKLFQIVKKVQYLASQKLIHNPNKRYSSTPDAIWIHGVCLNQVEYNVSTLEVKCPRKFHKFIPLHRCKTPAELKKLSRMFYWQTMDQMLNCGSAVGYFMAYHPQFPPAANHRIIEFRKMELWDDFKLLTDRKEGACRKFDEVKAEMLAP
jgi:hypothetical protein